MNVFLGCWGGWVRMDGIGLFLGGVMDSIVSGNCPFYLLEGGCIGGDGFVIIIGVGKVIFYGYLKII